MMSDNYIIIEREIERDSESRTSYFSKMEMESESHSPSSVSEDFKSEIVSLVDDSKMEGVFKGST